MQAGKWYLSSSMNVTFSHLTLVNGISERNLFRADGYLLNFEI